MAGGEGQKARARREEGKGNREERRVKREEARGKGQRARGGRQPVFNPLTLNSSTVERLNAEPVKPRLNGFS